MSKAINVEHSDAIKCIAGEIRDFTLFVRVLILELTYSCEWSSKLLTLMSLSIMLPTTPWGLVALILAKYKRYNEINHAPLIKSVLRHDLV